MITQQEAWSLNVQTRPLVLISWYARHVLESQTEFLNMLVAWLCVYEVVLPFAKYFLYLVYAWVL